VRTKFRLHAAVFAVIALGVLVLSTGVANAHSGGKGKLRIVATEIQSQFVDIGDPGISLGDELVFSERLFRHGREVGMSGAVCTVVSGGPTYDIVTNHCVGTLSLRNGQITLQGLIEVQGEDDPGPFTVAITGGTGDYRGAGGEAVVRQVTPTKAIYKLRFDSKKKHHGSSHRKHHGR
jgi:allene oxide cyclase-like protein